MIDKEKARMAKGYISDAINNFQSSDVQSSSKVEYYEKLAKLYYYLCKCCEEAEKDEYAQRSMSSMWRDDGRGGMGMENSMRRVRGGNGQYMSGADAAYESYAYADTKERIRQIMADPSVPYEAKEHLRKAMETVR